MKIKLLIFLLSIFMFFAKTYSQGIICGHIYENTTGKLLSGVELSLRGKQGLSIAIPSPPLTISNIEGYYELKYVKIKGQYMIDAKYIHNIDSLINKLLQITINNFI